MRDFKHTMDVLVKAYLNDTLVHGNCYACAVGNLIAEANGWKYVNCKDEPFRKIALDINAGMYLDGKYGGDWYEFDESIKRTNQGLNEIHSIGYTLKEVVRIENAFENAWRGENEDSYMFNGLIAVLEVLADIHGVDFSGKKVYEDKLTEIFATK